MRKIEEVFLYHITETKNKDSILSTGLIPQIGDRRNRCTKDRGLDNRISMCSRQDIKSWREALYSGISYEETTVFKINITNLIGIKRRKWKNGWEYGYWEKIESNRISIYED